MDGPVALRGVDDVEIVSLIDNTVDFISTVKNTINIRFASLDRFIIILI